MPSWRQIRHQHELESDGEHIGTNWLRYVNTLMIERILSERPWEAHVRVLAILKTDRSPHKTCPLPQIPEYSAM
jgi:hypothetical protein